MRRATDAERQAPRVRPGAARQARRARFAMRSAERRELARTRLIESRLTPNAISLTGLALVVVAAVLVWEQYYFLGGVAFIAGSIMDTLDGRYSRMSGKGTPFGAFLDSTLDRLEEGIVLAAVAANFALRRPASGGGGGDRGAGLADGLLHAGARGGPRRGMQGRHREPAGARRDPLRRSDLRARRVAGRLPAAQAGGVRPGRAQRDHGGPAMLRHVYRELSGAPGP